MNAPDLIDTITKAIGILEKVYSDSATESDLYEAAMLALAVQAGQDAGGTLLLTNDGFNIASELTFRRGPGNLWSGEFTRANVDFPEMSKSLEIHLGVYVLGKSKVAHECDVAILDHSEAERSRRGAVHPRPAGLIAAIEAKHYSASPGLGIGRGFIGLSTELGQSKCRLVFPAKESANIGALIAGKPSEAFGELVPDSAAAKRLRSHLDQAIRNWLLKG